MCMFLSNDAVVSGHVHRLSLGLLTQLRAL